jgi:hypothetical protein
MPAHTPENIKIKTLNTSKVFKAQQQTEKVKTSLFLLFKNFPFHFFFIIIFLHFSGGGILFRLSSQ